MSPKAGKICTGTFLISDMFFFLFVTVKNKPFGTESAWIQQQLNRI
jgi:hypothetical protein